MDAPKRINQGLLWAGVASTLLILGLGFVLARLTASRERSPEPLPVINTLPAFALTNQNGGLVSLADLRGQIWLADIIFTRCAGPCPEMTRRMNKLQSVLKPEWPVKLVTLTTDPEFDTPAVMKQYAARFGADHARWWFLTGNKAQIRQVAVAGLKLMAVEKEAGERSDPADLFIHSSHFVLVDKSGRLRAAFDSSDPDYQPRLMRAVRQLLDENAS